MGLGIRWLAGEKLRTLRHMFGVSYTEAYRSAKHFLHSILKCKELEITFPKNSEEWESMRKGFSSRSHMGVESMCVGAVDGFFNVV